MKKTLPALLCCLFAFSGAAFAGINYEEPASLLIYPFFSVDAGEDTIVSVANVNRNFEFDYTIGRPYGDVYAHFFYVDGEACDITNRRELLTPGDLLTVLVSEHNPAMNKGFLMVIAEHSNTRQPIKWDGIDGRGSQEYVSGLIGDTIVANGLLNFLWAIPAMGVKAGKEGDVFVGDKLDDLDDLAFDSEYKALPSELFISSFVEQGFLNTESTLILLDPTLSGDDIDLYYLFYNNDEIEFSQTDEFECWMMTKLDDIFNGSDNLGGAAATVPTGWVSVKAEDELPMLGMLIQAIAGDNYSSARLLHHAGEGAYGPIEF